MAMTISRHHAVRAGMHFPFYVFLDIILRDGSRFSDTPEFKELKAYYSGRTPAEMQEIFINPSFTLNDLAEAYRKYPEADTEQALWLNEQLHKALYSLDEYVYHWFRLGQICIKVFYDVSNESAQTSSDISAMKMICASCGISDKEVDALIDLFSEIYQALATGDVINPLIFTGGVFAHLSKLAIKHDEKNKQITGGHPYMKLLTLTLLLLAGLAGFYVLTTEKAILWLLFVVIAIPPILAVFFESNKLTGSNIVELYKIGMQGLPILGKLFGRRIP